MFSYSSVAKKSDRSHWAVRRNQQGLSGGSQGTSVSCGLSRPGTFTWDSGRQKKIRGAVGMLDTPLFKGG